MTAAQLLELLNEAGMHLESWDVETVKFEVGTFEVRLDYDIFSDFIAMHRVTTALIAADCLAGRIEERECGSDDEVSHWRVLVVQFPE